MICPDCKRETKGVDDQRNHTRCHWCYAVLPIKNVEAAKADKPAESKPMVAEPKPPEAPVKQPAAPKTRKTAKAK